ncbi:RND family efflux transporter, MFP subunit [Paenibacillus sp. 1_12]|uniref:efflux RND transporter periplasmic adaptor subunit n=1 Tax=Paenibacillus sp. 1_12 TaxID=1566278 RepID=UPI0008E312CD|nr:efflux RND transporter periplasmic adaptor subunit [Paenibacillus sp. 1_12]SFL38258.1 RND family efflux transporter, MFP subunit [Paenibacillus sp. 1_12]
MKPIRVNPIHTGIKTMGVMMLGAALLAGCSEAPKAQPAQAQANEVQLKQVKVTKVAKQKISEPLEQVADITSSIQLDVAVKVGGDVKEILKKRGDNVEKGEVIFRLDQTDVLISKEKANVTIAGTQQQLIKAREDLANSKQDVQNGIVKLEAAIKETEKNYNKMRNDFDLGLSTKFQLEQVETQLSNLKLDLQSSLQKQKTLETTNSLSQLEQGLLLSDVSIREADRTLEHMEVRASVSGVLTDLPIEVGMMLPAGFRSAQIQQLDPIKIKAELTEEAAALVRGKEELSFYISGSTEKHKAKVSYLADVVSTQSKAYSLELELPNQDRKFKPGMKVQVLLTEDQDQIVVTVPTLSIVRESGESYVFVMAGDTVEKRKVVLGRLSDTFQEVISGVKEGESLVTSGQNQLKDKEKVKLSQ